MPKQTMSEKVTIVIAFLSGVIFSNAVTSLIDGNYIISFLSFLTVAVAVLIKRFIDWQTDDEEI